MPARGLKWPNSPTKLFVTRVTVTENSGKPGLWVLASPAKSNHGHESEINLSTEL